MSDGAPLVVVEVPGPIVGKGRPRFDGRSGAVYTPSATVTAESRLAYSMAQRWLCAPLDEPLALTIEVRVAIPRSKSKKWQAAALSGAVLPVGRPDLDNIAKLVADSGNKIIWLDDSRITELHVRRRYAVDPGLTVEVHRG